MRRRLGEVVLRGFAVLSVFALVAGPASAQTDPDAGWTVFAGGSNTGGSAPGQFAGVNGVAVDAQGNVYATDGGNHRVQKLSPGGAPLAQVSTATDQPAFVPTGVTLDGQGNLYVVEPSGDRIQKLSPTGELLAKWGSRPPRGVSVGAGYQDPRVGLAVDSQGNVYLPDWENNQILKLSPQGQTLAHWSSQVGQQRQFGLGFDVAVDSGDNLYAADFVEGVIKKYSPDGQLLAQLDLRGDAGRSLVGVVGLAVDSLGNIYVSSDGVQKFSPQGERLAHWGLHQGDQPGIYAMPTGVAVDGQGDIYVADQYGNRVLKLAAAAAAQQPGAAGGTPKPPAVSANSPAAQPSDQSQLVSCQPVLSNGSDSGWSGSGIVCDDGTGYRLNSDGSLVSRYDPAHPDAGMTAGPWPTTSVAMAEWTWVDPELHQACYYFAGVTRSSVPDGSCHPSSPDPQQPDNAAGATSDSPPVAAPPAGGAAGAPPSEAATQSPPDILTDSQRANILSAVDRANSAWTIATQTLDGSALNGNVAGQELTDDLVELQKLRGQGQTRRNSNTAFVVTDVTLDAPGHAIVRTRETWSAELYETATGRLLQRTPSTTYSETYTVEYQSASWIVTLNKI